MVKIGSHTEPCLTRRCDPHDTLYVLATCPPHPWCMLLQDNDVLSKHGGLSPEMGEVGGPWRGGLGMRVKWQMKMKMKMRESHQVRLFYRALPIEPITILVHFPATVKVGRSSWRWVRNAHLGESQVAGAERVSDDRRPLSSCKANYTGTDA